MKTAKVILLSYFVIHILSSAVAADGSCRKTPGPVYPSLDLVVNDNHQIATSQVEVIFQMHDVASLRFLRLYPADQYARLIMGYDDSVVFGEYYHLPEGTDSLQLIVRQYGGDWGQVKFIINETTAVTLGDYPSVSINTEWQKITVPLSAFGGVDTLQTISFPIAKDIQMDVQEIRFSGGAEDFVWFGVTKFDNAIKSNISYQVNTGETLLTPQEIQLQILNQNRNIADTTMPFYSIMATLSPGENKLVGVLKTEFGTVYSDTVTYTVAKGITLYWMMNVSCKGAADGWINIEMDGGTPPYEYEWSNGQTSKNASGLAPGVYTLTVTDANGKTASRSFNITEPVELTATLSRPSGCEGVIEASGGTAEYYYTIDDGHFKNFGILREKVREIKGNQERWAHNEIVEIGADMQNNFYVAGNYDGDFSFQHHGAGAINRQGIFIVKFDPKGEFLWNILSLPDIVDDGNTGKLKDMVVNEDGDIFVLFYTPGATIIESARRYTLGKGNYLARITPEGTMAWIKDMPEGAGYVGLDAFNKVYVSGKLSENFFAVPQFDHIRGGTDLFLALYSENGELQRINKISGHDSEEFGDMVVGDGGEVYLTGWYRTDISFDDLTLNSKGLDDLFIAKYDANGNPVWARSGGGSRNYDRGTTLALYRDILYVGMIFDGADGWFGDIWMNRSLVELGSLNALDGSTNWTAPVVFIDDNSPRGNEIKSIAVDRWPFVYVTAVSEGRIPSGYFLEQYRGPFMMMYNDQGAVFRTEYLSKRGGSFSIPIIHTNDEYVIYPDYTSDSLLTINKFGFPQKVTIDMSSVTSTITISDIYSCTYTMNVSNIPFEVDVPSICYTTAGDNGKGVKILWDAEANKGIDYYKIYREDKAINDFKLIGQGDSTGVFYDSLVDTEKRSYRYAISAVQCEGESELSTPHKTMHLTVNEGNKGQINLIWDRYEGFDYPSFKIRRGTSPDQMEYLDQVPSNVYTYTDKSPSSTSMYYQIVIERNMGGTPVGCGEHSGSKANGRVASQKVAVASNIATRYGKAGNLTFYPNPAHDQLTVKFSPDGDEYQLKLLDAGGRVVRTIEGVFDKAVIERGNLPAGIYHVVLSKDSGEPLYGRIAFE